MAEVDVPVVALLAKRTFWEKATILHAEYFRAHDKALPDRYSRHWMDECAPVSRQCSRAP